MTRSANPSPVKSIRTQAIMLALAKMAVTALRFVLPMILVRAMVEETYAAYRLVWLVVMSVEIIAPLGLPRSLLYFVPKAKGRLLQRYVFQTLLLITVLGVASGAVVVLLTGILPAFAPLEGVRWLTAIFLGSWVGARLIEFLPSAEQRSGVQGGVIVSLEFVRIAVIAGVALWSADLWSVLCAMAGVGLFKYGVQVAYMVRRYGIPRQWPRWAEMKEQLHFSVPMGLTFFLNNFRKLSEGWVVAFIFTPIEFAIYSTGAMNIPVVTLLRRTLSQVITPRLSQYESEGNIKEVFRLVRKANLVSFTIVFPLVCFIWIYADEIVSLLFTETYVGAAPVLRIYLLVMVKQSVDITNIFLVFKRQVFIFRLNAFLLPISIAISMAFSYWFGIVGAAVGSVACVFIQTIIMHYKALDMFSVSIGELQYWGKLVICLAASLAAVLGSSLLFKVIGGNDWVAILASGVACAGLYAVFLYVFGLKDLLKLLLMGRKRPARRKVDEAEGGGR